ncbi:hypothetical protein BKA70DRAFT_1245569 [Coprinopsis sp. MPI-PUGE-AT-0042]|nr:hypothetical protein BKA70DRAFT_1245569 [Coprinopsis sp. MPI-PUGE-AT-0042]
MENPAILIDSSSSKITYNGILWQQLDSQNSTNVLGGSIHACDIEGELPEDDEDVYLSVASFLTKGFEVYGIMEADLEFKARVDKDPYNILDTTKSEDYGKPGVTVFEAGSIPGQHVLKLFPKRGRFVVDYILVTPVEKTNLNGEDLVFDDANVSFNYTGPWTPLIPDLPQLPFNRTLMSTTQPGSTLSFPFTGSSITVYGAFNRSSVGLVAAEFSVDDSTPSSLVLANQTEPEQPGSWTLHQQYFQYNVTETPQDEHVLHVTVKDASVSQPFYIDYVVVQGNEHSRMAEKSFQKTGSAMKSSGMTIGISFLAIAVVILLVTTWRLYRKRQKAKALSPNKA